MKEERLHFLETVIQAQTEYFIAAAIKVSSWNPCVVIAF